MTRIDARSQDGFSMIVVLGVLTVCAALTVAVFSAVVGDMPLRKESRERKASFAAAEAGLNFYLSRLTQDNDYWTYCDQAAAPNATELNPVNQAWNGTGTDPRRWRVVPQDTARYTVELVPAAGQAACVPGPTAARSMIEPATGTMRLRATGDAGGERRTILATLRRKSFLDYLYFTDYEVTDPAALTTNQQYIANCTKYRASRPAPGTNGACSDIQFASGDRINGPFHTNDDILACPGAIFGRNGADRIEASGPAPGWKNGGNCGTGQPDFKSTFQAGVPALAVPASNAKVAQIAVAPYILVGTNKVEINGTSMTVTPAGATATTMALPDNGVIYAKSGAGCGSGASPVIADYNESAGCANLTVRGTYAKSLTIVSDKDIIVDGNLKANGDFLMGLIATNYVRVKHPVTGRSGLSCTNLGTQIPSPLEIEAAILTLQHSFIVDNYYCGAPLGTLKVTGAIAQRFRGPVGATDSGGGMHGYLKDYNYDDRLKFRNPPYFLEPEDAAWRVLRRNEQAPGVGAASN